MTEIQYYTIQAGDSLRAISQKFGTTVNELIRINGFANQNVTLHPGQQIKVKGFADSVMYHNSGTNSGNLNKLVQWFRDRIGVVQYSQNQQLRQGPNYYDCASAVLAAMIHAGFITPRYLGNTATLFAMEGQELIPIPRSEARFGDVFITGPKPGGQHAGVFVDNLNIVHCVNETYDMKETPLHGWVGSGEVFCYRLRGGSLSGAPQPTNPITQPLNPTKPITPGTDSFYTIAAGDSLWKISQQFNTTVAELVKLNGFPSQDVVLHPGQRIMVKKGQSTTPVVSEHPVEPTLPTSNSEVVESSYRESGQFTANRSLSIRNEPNQLSAEVATLYAGENVVYDMVYKTNRFIYISYVSYSGTRRYLAIRTNTNGQRGPLWGTIV
ncbi:LysM peptidoglycan-binding domain-containing protein [Aerococcaceae bacterium zg-ZJ1578]|uniref:LysM peptidoglycan-binding domain-containing protein n=1 Tax=Aerococcaceae bacterium zg-252 TaxID=2796928 RepID=UPI001A2B0EEA|nr:LysM peptidoglycan-binding domain-containing protein [Aerococcaceae bacterium zg-1578]